MGKHHCATNISRGVYFPADVERGQATIEAVEFPARRISLTFTHPTAGDEYFVPMVDAAARELFDVDPIGTLMEYTATNGVHIKVGVHD